MNSKQRKVPPIPQLNTNVVVNHTLRFKNVSAGGVKTAVYSHGLIASLGAVATTATNLVARAISVKINSVEVWGPASASGSDIAIEWTGPSFSSSKEYTDTTLSTSEMSHLKCKPPKQSQSPFWIQGTASSTLMFYITSPTNSIVDLNLTWVLVDDETALSNNTFVGAVVGTNYFLALDNRFGGGAGAYNPVGLQFIT